MDPISREIFSYDFHRFVLQDATPIPPSGAEPVKKFEVKPAKKSEKSKKDQYKEKRGKK
ncbi:MAG: hypothetical protein LLG04_14590 [Parachlamydia sp.]|nr:hypothetical protein [Parachlamydia sp.]